MAFPISIFLPLLVGSTRRRRRSVSMHDRPSTPSHRYSPEELHGRAAAAESLLRYMREADAALEKARLEREAAARAAAAATLWGRFKAFLRSYVRFSLD